MIGLGKTLLVMPANPPGAPMMDPPSPAEKAFRSMPAENALSPLPVSTTAATSWSSASSSSAAERAELTAPLMALRASGRLMVRISTCPRRSRRTSSAMSLSSRVSSSASAPAVAHRPRLGTGRATAAATLVRSMARRCRGGPQCRAVPCCRRDDGIRRGAGSPGLLVRGGHVGVPDRGRVQRPRRTGQQLGQVGAGRADRTLGHRLRLLAPTRAGARPCGVARLQQLPPVGGVGAPRAHRGRVRRGRARALRGDPGHVRRAGHGPHGDPPPLHPPVVAGRGVLADPGLPGPLRRLRGPGGAPPGQATAATG